MFLIITTTFQGLHSLHSNLNSTNQQLSTVMMLVARLVGQDCDAGTSSTQEKFSTRDYPDAKERFGAAMEAARSKPVPTSWVIVKGGSDNTMYYLKQCRDASERKLKFTAKAALHHSRVYAIVDEPNHTSCSHGGVTKAPTRIVDGVDQAWVGEHTRFADDVVSNFRIIDQCYTTRGNVKTPPPSWSPEDCMVFALQDPTIVGFSYNYKPSIMKAYFITKYNGDDHSTTYHKENPNQPGTTNSKRWTHHCLYLKK